MNDTYIVTIYVVIDDILKAYGYQDDCRAQGSAKEKFFGWRLHLVCTEAGIPVSLDLLPASYQDLTALHELAFCFPAGATLFGDKGFISADDAQSLLHETGVRLVTPKRKNKTPNDWADDYDLALFCKRIESVYSQLESMGLQRLHARTNLGFDLKAFASVLALAFTNLISD